jgi:hypothetical protein
MEALSDPRCCQSCCYLMRSETSTTGFRCGHDYFMTTPLLRKFKTMSQYPVVRMFTSCESWAPVPREAPID